MASKYYDMLDNKDKQLKLPLCVDPPDCGCTECITGEYVNYSSALPDYIKEGIIRGEVQNNTWMTLLEMANDFDRYDNLYS